MSSLDPVMRSAIDAMVVRAVVPPMPPKIASVLELVSFHMGIARRDILGPSRERIYFRARAAICWLSHELRLGSTHVIGRAIGNRHHTTVIQARVRGEDFRQRDPAFRLLTDRLLAHFRNPPEPTEMH